MEPLLCPLCCNGVFDTHTSLKQHIQMILKNLENLSCPSCKITCKLIDLPKHLDQECVNNTETKKNKFGQKNMFVGQGENYVQVKQEAQNDFITDEITESTEPDMAVDTIQDEPDTVYSCEMCDMTFSSIEEHLAQYHEGEEVFLETPCDEEGVDEQNLQEYLPADDMFDEQEEGDTVEVFEEDNNERPESQVSQHEEQNDSFDNSPLITKYLLDRGRLQKLTEEESAEIPEQTKIIKIYNCRNCELQFPNLTHFEQHHCNKKPMKSTRKEVRRSPQVKKGELIRYQCSFCSSTYLTLPELQEHMKIHLNADESGTIQQKTITMSLHICPICETKFPTYKQLKLHSKMHDPSKTKKAPVQVDPDKEFQCTVCNRTYEKQYQEIHMKSHYEDDPFICIICNKTLDSEENLVLHSKAHSTAKKFTCSYCKKLFINYLSLEKHVKNECQKRDFACFYCGRRFSKPHEKVKHERIHTGEKPHICDICGKAFRVKYCLTLHMRTHTGVRPYTCHLCGKQFKSHSVCNHHIKTHSDDRNYKCPFCPKAFKTAVQLAGHKNCHTKPFACTECCRPFASLYAVKAHMQSHKKGNSLRFNCWMCGAEYGRSYALKEHLSAHHGYDVDSEVNKLEAVADLEENENAAAEPNEIEEINEDVPMTQEACETEVVQIFGEEEEYVVHLPEDSNGTVGVNHIEAVEV